MKKLICLGTFCLTSISLMAQTTCETRVDAHQEATTTQRVAYCLTPDSVVVTPASRGLVFSSVSTPAVAPTPVQTPEKPTAKAGYFKPQHYAITREYVDSAQFPQMQQGTATQGAPAGNTSDLNAAYQEFAYVDSPTLEPAQSEEVYTSQMFPEVSQPQAIPMGAADLNQPTPLVEDEFVYVDSPSTPLGRSTLVVPSAQSVPVANVSAVVNQPGALVAPREHFMIDEVDADGNLVPQLQRETTSGLKARQSKPGRQLMKADTLSVQIPAQDPAYTYHEDLTQPYEPEEIPAGTVSYAPATAN